MSHAKHITLYGAAHIDRTGLCFAKPEPGKSNPGEFTNFPGGAAWNVASNLSVLGANVKLHSIIGGDQGGRYLKQSALDRSFEFNPQVSSQKSTATYTSILAPGGELTIALADMGIYEEFDFPKAPPPDSTSKKHSWTLVDANLPTEAITQIARTQSSKIAAMTVSSAKASKLKSSLSTIDILFTNRAELASLCSEKRDSDIQKLISRFQDMGGTSAVISNGAEEIWSIDSTANIEHHTVPTIAFIKDVTGAGDALAAGILFELMSSKPLAQSVQFGIRLSQAILEVEGAWRPDLKTLA